MDFILKIIVRFLLSIFVCTTSIIIYHNEFNEFIKDEFKDKFEKTERQTFYLMIIAYFIVFTLFNI